MKGGMGRGREIGNAARTPEYSKENGREDMQEKYARPRVGSARLAKEEGMARWEVGGVKVLEERRYD
jgi:hypothetical protein